MSGDLRQKIADVLVRDAFGLTTRTAALRQADAVIAELGLKRVEMGEWDVLAQGFRGYRYVTPWDVDDE